MHTFMERLQARGIRCIPAAEAEVSYLFGEFRQDSLSVRMASYETSVQDVVKQIMKESDNLNAEAMLCRLGVQSSGKKRVSAEDGLSAIRMLIKEMGYTPIGIIWQMVAAFPITTTFHRNSWFLSCDMPTRVRMFSRNFIRLCPLAAWTVHWSSA